MKGDPSRPENWYQLARRDFDKARRDLALGDLPYAAILLQQATEKACKGWLIARGWKSIKTHDLVFLLDEIRSRGLDLSWFAPSAALLPRNSSRNATFPGMPNPLLLPRKSKTCKPKSNACSPRFKSPDGPRRQLNRHSTFGNNQFPWTRSPSTR